MSAEPERLRATLEELRRGLTEVEQLDPALRSQLVAALHDIQSALAAKGSPEESLMQRLRDAAQDFEESHPALAGNLGSLIDTLGRMGI
ncbi:MAG: DUF4404 family protein [Pirellulales bacterium]|nr:DUF4404 family protein [Pirellulales bacterium]